MDARDTTPNQGQRFPIRLDRRFGWVLRIFGVRPGNAWVDVGPTTLESRFGWSHVVAPLSSIERWSIEGPWSPLTAMGVRRGILKADVTFGGSPHGGIRVDFRDGQHPKYSIFHPPAFYFTVDDLEGLAAALAAHGIPGEDRRKDRSR